MCTYEHGIRDRVKVIRDDNLNSFNRELEYMLAEGWRLIQPIESYALMPSSGTFGKVYHIAVLAYNRDHYES